MLLLSIIYYSIVSYSTYNVPKMEHISAQAPIIRAPLSRDRHLSASNNLAPVKSLLKDQ